MAQLKKKTQGETYSHRRGWGSELWVENIPEYCGKVLFLDKGKRCSMHFHMDKVETMFLYKGRVNIDMIDPETGKRYTVELFEGDSIKIPRAQAHQIIALEHSDLIEFSTTHQEEDSYRIEKGD